MDDNTEYYTLENAVIAAIKAGKPETLERVASYIHSDMPRCEVRELADWLGLDAAQ